MTGINSRSGNSVLYEKSEGAITLKWKSKAFLQIYKRLKNTLVFIPKPMRPIEIMRRARARLFLKSIKNKKGKYRVTEELIPEGYA